MSTPTLSWLDPVMVALLAGSAVFGFRQGLVRQLFLLTSVYVGTVLSAQYHEYLAAAILAAAPSSAPQMAKLVAFVILTIAFTIFVTWLIWTAYRETKLPSVVMLDEAGGAILGGVIGLFIIGLSLMLAQYALEAPWPLGSPIKYLLYSGVVNSGLKEIFSSPLPLIHAVLEPWLPSSVPLIGG